MTWQTSGTVETGNSIGKIPFPDEQFNPFHSFNPLVRMALGTEK